MFEVNVRKELHSQFVSKYHNNSAEQDRRKGGWRATLQILGYLLTLQSYINQGAGGRLSRPDYYSTPSHLPRILGPSYGPAEVYFLEALFIIRFAIKMKNEPRYFMLKETSSE